MMKKLVVLSGLVLVLAVMSGQAIAATVIYDDFTVDTVASGDWVQVYTNQSWGITTPDFMWGYDSEARRMSGHTIAVGEVATLISTSDRPTYPYIHSLVAYDGTDYTTIVSWSGSHGASTPVSIFNNFDLSTYAGQELGMTAGFGINWGQITNVQLDVQANIAKASEVISMAFHNGGATLLGSAEQAGFVLEDNWNNIQNVGGTGLAGSGIVLVDSEGIDSGATLSYSVGTSWYNNNRGDQSGSYEMMEGWFGLNAADSGYFTVSSLPSAFTDSGYNVYIYFDSDMPQGSAQTMDFTIGSTTIYGVEEYLFSGIFTKATGTSVANATVGNYVTFSGLTSNNFTLTADSNQGRAAITGIQISTELIIPAELTITETGDSTEVAEGGIGSLPQSDTFTVKLSRIPDGIVTVNLTEQNDPNDLMISPSILTFSPADWAPREVTVTALDDDISEFDPEITQIEFNVSSDDTGYDNKSVGPLSINVRENDCGAWGYQAGDANQDCRVNLGDMAKFSLDWLDAPTSETDLIVDGVVNLADLKQMAIGWLYCTLPNDPECGRPMVNRPNIILFLVDDMGWNDTSVEFHTQPTVWNELYQTPHMQTLANKGVKFRNAYAASPVCSPTRCSIMTGKNPGRNHISSWIGHGMPSNTYLNSPSWATTGLQPNDGNTKLTSVLKDNGYRTIHVGKAHFGASGTSGADPTNLDFDVNRGGSNIGAPYSYFLSSPTQYPNLNYPSGTYLTDALTLAANEEIDQAVADGVPFYMNMAHYAIHTPISGQGDPDFLGNYSGRPNPEDDYAAMIESMDASLGSILANLQEEGIADNTVIIFFSDNGGLSNHTRNMSSSYTIPGGSTVQFSKDTHNSPIQSGKGSGYEGGIRVPLIVAWAGQDAGASPISASLAIQPGTISDMPVISDDLFPTILQIAGVANLSQYTQDIDGLDMTPILNDTGTFDANRPIYTHYPHQWYSDIGVGLGVEPYTSIRKGDWKLIYFYGDGYKDGSGYDPKFELYDLANDIGETNNLVASQSAIAQGLITDLKNWMTDAGVQTPVSKATGQAVPLPDVSAL
jgi:arylsulfatase A-like enzyme